MKQELRMNQTSDRKCAIRSFNFTFDPPSCFTPPFLIPSPIFCFFLHILSSEPACKFSESVLWSRLLSWSFCASFPSLSPSSPKIVFCSLKWAPPSFRVWSQIPKPLFPAVALSCTKKVWASWWVIWYHNTKQFSNKDRPFGLYCVKFFDLNKFVQAFLILFTECSTCIQCGLVCCLVRSIFIDAAVSIVEFRTKLTASDKPILWTPPFCNN